jgi:hypothetical protein
MRTALSVSSRNGKVARAGIGELPQRRLLRLFEGLEHRTGQPGMTLGERAAHADDIA